MASRRCTLPPHPLPTKPTKDRNVAPIMKGSTDPTFVMEDEPARLNETRARKQHYGRLLQAKWNGNDTGCVLTGARCTADRWA